jgi:hypothetical protein
VTQTWTSHCWCPRCVLACELQWDTAVVSLCLNTACPCCGCAQMQGLQYYLHESPGALPPALCCLLQGAPERKKLSPEEARKAAEELMRKAREKREREERELELLREKVGWWWWWWWW